MGVPTNYFFYGKIGYYRSNCRNQQIYYSDIRKRYQKSMVAFARIEVLTNCV
ncbi:hypothetical protein LEP1GSC040_1437 [Leptospira santarosai str. 2000030832]|nr:hypothetical protein LEP1GSC040_1437 [Leptospira santarosai str. 2000030832]